MSQSTITKTGDTILLNRGYKVTPDYTAPQDFGVRNSDESISYASTTLGNLVPITDGTVIEKADAIAPWTVNSSNVMELNTILSRKGPSALSIIKNDTGNAQVIANRAVDTYSFEDKEAWAFIYIDAELLPELKETGAVIIRLEDDTSNYYEISYDRAELSAGWNILVFDIADVTTTGTPVITALEGLRVIYETTLAETPTLASDFVLDEIKLVETNDFYKPFVTGFPEISEANNETVIRKYLTTVEAVGFNISGVGTYNRDEPRKLFGASTFPSEAKSFDNEFTIITKNRLL